MILDQVIHYLFLTKFWKMLCTANYFSISKLIVLLKLINGAETSPQLTFTKFIELIDSDNYVLAVFLDLHRAFETIDRNILLH